MRPLSGTRMRTGHRIHAAGQGVAAARDPLDPAARVPFAPVPYFWSDRYDMKIQAYDFSRGHGQVAVVEGDLTERRFLAARRTGDLLVGVPAAGMPPKAIRTRRRAIAPGTAWNDVVVGAATAAEFT